jgi:hypothetical protein
MADCSVMTLCSGWSSLSVNVVGRVNPVIGNSTRGVGVVLLCDCIVGMSSLIKLFSVSVHSKKCWFDSSFNLQLGQMTV